MGRARLFISGAIIPSIPNMRTATLGLLLIFIALVGGISLHERRSPPSVKREALESRHMPITATLQPNVSSKARPFIGKWVQSDSLDRNNIHTLQFRADGTIAEMENEIIVAYNQKSSMDTGTASVPAYPASATTTGLWWTVSDPTKEMISSIPLKPAMPLAHYLGYLNIPARAIYVGEDFGIGYPAYIALEFTEDEVMHVRQVYPVDAEWTYKRVSE